ncbi:PilZ domain-containing protein [Thermomonas alba]|uniref:PilZ domain-containing protein n=1 Tax=Thermomonas alba TaxID=2888525 RepID=UPI001F03A7C7|nr:PilZ domain-containing protein [Thermomonas alba]
MKVEARRQPRRSVPGMVEVFDTILEEPVGHLGNLSVGGMLLIAHRRLPDDALFQLRFQLPDGQRDAPPLEVGAHVLWQAQAGAPGQSLIGMRFLGLSPDALQRLHLWVAQAER